MNSEQRETFARIQTLNCTKYYKSLAEAFAASDDLNEQHAVCARDIHGNYVQVHNWKPDCADPQEDTFGGERENQWDANEHPKGRMNYATKR